MTFSIRATSFKEAEELFRQESSGLTREVFILEENQIPIDASCLGYKKDGATKISWFVFPQYRGNDFEVILLTETMKK